MPTDVRSNERNQVMPSGSGVRWRRVARRTSGWVVAACLLAGAGVVSGSGPATAQLPVNTWTRNNATIGLLGVYRADTATFFCLRDTYGSYKENVPLMDADCAHRMEVDELGRYAHPESVWKHVTGSYTKGGRVSRCDLYVNSALPASQGLARADDVLQWTGTQGRAHIVRIADGIGSASVDEATANHLCWHPGPVRTTAMPSTRGVTTFSPLPPSSGYKFCKLMLGLSTYGKKDYLDFDLKHPTNREVIVHEATLSDNQWWTLVPIPGVSSIG